MKHRVKVSVLETTLNEELQRDYLADPESGRCPCFKPGDTFEFWREENRDDFYKFGRGCGFRASDDDMDFPCAEAWDCISRYIYSGLQGGAFMHNWTRDDRVMIACCNDGTRPVIFKLERLDIPEDDADRLYLESHDFTSSKEDAYTG